jgi:hypothetical protein
MLPLNNMSERDHVGQISALQDMVQAVELDLSKITTALSRNAGDNLATFTEPASIKSRLKDSEQELLLLPS